MEYPLARCAALLLDAEDLVDAFESVLEPAPSKESVTLL